MHYESSAIESIVEAVINSPYSDKEIIIVDDYSTDGTRDILKNNLEKKVAKIIYQDRNRGKGLALRTGFKEATGTIFITIRLYWGRLFEYST